MKEFTYEDWLAGHDNRKSMMEKLERSLIPYELFAMIPLKNNRQRISDTIRYGNNTYTYTVSYDYSRFGNDIYDADLIATDLQDRWNNRLMGYNKFKVVMRGKSIVTIYSDHEDYFKRIISMFEREDIEELYRNRSSYVNNLLARYIILRLIEAHDPNMQLLAGLETREEGKISVLAANANRTHIYMYAFSKRDAIEMAHRFDGLAQRLTIIYFMNQDFQKEGNSVTFRSEETEVISIRSFYNSLNLDTMERRVLERKVLMLVSLLYDEDIDWHVDRIMSKTLCPPRKWQPTVIYRTLLEDALNVIEDKPRSHADIFHYLCAANMINAFVNICNKENRYSERQIRRMYQAKQRIFRTLETLATTGNRNVKISMSAEPAIFAEINIGRRAYQFSFRGFNDNMLSRYRAAGISQNGKYDGLSLQAIATHLYQYSYIQRWKGLKKGMSY